MATFYVLPPRECLNQSVADVLGRLLPGLPLPADTWDVVAEQLAASWPADVFLVPRDDLPEGETVEVALASSFGAEPGDRVVEVRLAGAGRSWAVGGVSGVAAAR